MVMVVADAALEARRGPGRLDTPDETPGDEDGERVVHRLKRDGAYLRADGLHHAVGRDVGLSHDGPQDSQSLRRDLDSALSKEISRVDVHLGSITGIWNDSNI